MNAKWVNVGLPSTTFPSREFPEEVGTEYMIRFDNGTLSIETRRNTGDWEIAYWAPGNWLAVEARHENMRQAGVMW